MSVFGKQKMHSQPAFAMILNSLDSSKHASAYSVASTLPLEWEINHDEGKLAIDVAHTKNDIIVVSTMAGALPDRVEVYIHNELLTIRGIRNSPICNEQGIHYYYQECFWGVFSRTIVLPMSVQGDLARAEYKNGILKIIVPKRDDDTHVPVIVIDE